MISKKRIFFSAGEQSGDMHTSGLIAEMLKLTPDIQMAGLGGDGMRELGVDLHYHCRDLAALGFWEVASKIRFFMKVKQDCVRYFKDSRPDLAVLTDYPGLNLKLAQKCKNLGIPVVYFIMPQVWAWKPKRALLLKKYCDLLLSILPFEAEFFQKYDTKIEYVGHPLIDRIAANPDIPNLRKKLKINNPAVCLLPGSRLQEIDKNLKPMIRAVELIRTEIPNLQVFLIKASDLADDLYRSKLGPAFDRIELVRKNKYDYIRASDCAVVASGTATLETALCGTPAVVIYRTSAMTYEVARRLIKLDYIGLANIVADEDVYPELIQHNATPQKIAEVIKIYLNNPELNNKKRGELNKLRMKLHPAGAYSTAAKLIYERFLR